MATIRNKRTAILDGSIRKRPNGSWEYRLYLGQDHEGKKRYKSFYAKTEKELKAKVKEYHQNQQKYDSKVYSTIFQDYALYWMKNYKLHNLKPVSYDRLEQTYNKVCEYLGYIQMDNITSEDVQYMINDLARTKAYSTVKKHYEFVNNVFQQAVASRKLTFNPCVAVSLPAERNMRVQTRKAEIFTKEETDAMYVLNEKLKGSCNQFYKHLPAILLMLNTGWRVGELLALEWADIDLENRKAVISKTLSKARERDEDGVAYDRHKRTSAEKTKTRSGERITPLNDTAMELLKQIQDYNQRMKITSDYVICTSKGGYVSERNLLRTFHCVMGVIGAQKSYTIHSLRHTFASRLLRNGVDISVVSKLLGHADINTTYGKYIHLLNEQISDEALKYGRI